MKQFYLTLSALRFAKSLLLSAFCLFAFFIAGAQVYYANLSGPAEAPPNNSAGTGKSLVTITGNFMRVQANFSGLTGNVTASHIHAATAVAGTGTAGVATQLPTFIGFPSGVQAGTYDNTFDMTLASSYNPAYITNNGGTPASAFTALKAAIAAGRSYLNIHSNVFPGGEIRGFLLACPTITVTIPDAFALAQGTLPNTVYPAYAPASSLTLQANASGGTGPYSYNWSNGSTSSSITVSPTVTTQYSVVVNDQNGCAGTASKTVNVMDISGGNKDNKIVVCHNGGKSLTIATPAVAAHLKHGDMLGSCGESRPASNILVKAMTNPSPNYFELRISGDLSASIQVTVYDLMGRVVETRSALPSNQMLQLGSFYKPGVYLVQLTQGEQMQTIKLVKTN